MQPETWKPPITTGTSSLRKARAKIEGAGKLVRLDPDQPDKSLAVSLYPSRHRLDVDDLVALVIGLELDVDVGTESFLLGASGQKSVDAGEAVRGNGGEPPLDHVAVIIIVRRLDEDDPERPLSHCPPCSAARHPFGPGMRTLKTDPNLLPALGSPTAILPVLIRRSKERSQPAHRVHAPRGNSASQASISSIEMRDHPVRSEFRDRNVGYSQSRPR